MMRTRKARFALFVGVMLTLSVSFYYWLTHANSGREFALHQIQKFLPNDAKLHWQNAQGNFADGLTFEQLSYESPSFSVQAKQMQLRVNFGALLARNLDIKKLSAQHVRVDLAKDNEPFEFPHWPDSLPKLDLPIRISLQQADIRDVQIFEDKRWLYAVHSVQAGLTLKPGELNIQNIQAKSDQGKLQLHGWYAPKRNYATKLTGKVELKKINKLAQQSLRIEASGDVKQFQLRMFGVLPEAVDLNWKLQTIAGKAQWQLLAKGTRFEPKYLGFADESVYQFNVNARGDSQLVQLAGSVQRDAQKFDILPSKIRVIDDVLHLQQVQARYGGGEFTANGKINTANELTAKDLQISIAHFPLPISSTQGKQIPVVLNGQLQVNGKISQWQAQATARLTRGKDYADLDLQGAGNQFSLNLPILHVKTAQGGLQAQFGSDWKEGLSFSLAGDLQQFDPSFFYADFPGKINGKIRADIKQLTNKPWQGSIALSELGGSLRARALSGNADVDFVGMKITGDADLNLGASHLVFVGKHDGGIHLQANFAPLNFNDIHPEWRGTMKGEVLLQGGLQNPDFRVQLAGNDILVQEYRAEQFSLQGDTLNTKQTQFTARGVHVAGQDFPLLSLRMQGKPANANLNAQIEHTRFTLQSAGQLQWSSTAPKYLATQLQLSSQDFGTWLMPRASQLAWHNSSYEFSPFCLQNSANNAQLCAEDKRNTVALSGNAIPLAMLEPWLNNAGKEFVYSGMANLSGNLPKDFSLDNGNINAVVDSLRIGVKSNANHEVARVDKLQVDINWIAGRLNGKVSARLPKNGLIEGEYYSGASQNAAINGRLNVQIYDLSWLELFSLDIAQPQGQINGEVEISGTRDSPLINGAYTLKDFSVQIPSLGLKLSDGLITAKSRDNFALLVKGSIRSGDGRMSVTGVWDPAEQLPQPINLRLRSQDFSVADTPNLQLTANTDLILLFEHGVYSMDGAIDVNKGYLNLETLNSAVSISSDVQVLDPEPSQLNRDLLKLSLNLQVSVNEQLKISGYGLDGTVSGKIAVNSPYNSLTKLNGALSLSGKYASYGQALQIKRGNLIYNHALVYEPRLDILTERVIPNENISVGLEITGIASKPKARVVSSPSMSDADALSWLLFGRPLNLVSSNQAQSINARSMALNAGGTLLVGTLGKQIGLDQATVSGSRVLGDSTLTIGKQLSPRVFVSYGVSLLGIGQVITLKYLLKNGLDVSVESEQSQTRKQTSAALNWRK